MEYEISKIPDDETILRKASQLENIGLKALDALYLVQKSVEIMLTTDDEIVKTFRANKSIIKIRVENPVRWLMEVTENES